MEKEEKQDLEVPRRRGGGWRSGWGSGCRASGSSRGWASISSSRTAWASPPPRCRSSRPPPTCPWSPSRSLASSPMQSPYAGIAACPTSPSAVRPLGHSLLLSCCIEYFLPDPEPTSAITNSRRRYSHRTFPGLNLTHCSRILFIACFWELYTTRMEFYSFLLSKI